MDGWRAGATGEADEAGAAIAGVAVMLLLFGMVWRGRTACFSVVLLHPVKARKKEGPRVRLTHGARHARAPASRGMHATGSANARFYLLVFT